MTERTKHLLRRNTNVEDMTSTDFTILEETQRYEPNLIQIIGSIKPELRSIYGLTPLPYWPENPNDGGNYYLHSDEGATVIMNGADGLTKILIAGSFLQRSTTEEKLRYIARKHNNNLAELIGLERDELLRGAGLS